MERSPTFGASLDGVPIVTQLYEAEDGQMSVRAFTMADSLRWAAEEIERLRELLVQVLDRGNLSPGLADDIAHALGLVVPWRCPDCECVNRYNEAFCYRCGAGPDLPQYDEKVSDA